MLLSLLKNSISTLIPGEFVIDKTKITILCHNDDCTYSALLKNKLVHNKLGNN